MATAVTAIIAKAQRRIIDHFMSADAVSPESAVAFVPKRLVAERQFARFQRAGVVRTTEDGRYWIDIPSYRKWENSRRLRVTAAVIIAVAAAAALLA
ncbi:hypothetical protein [Sphingomonas sp.]|uniref:hypothetical protein n=1 Tax=Sphingomonas sp. TaxID=28214 RepID=UPI0038A3ADE7